MQHEPRAATREHSPGPVPKIQLTGGAYAYTLLKLPTNRGSPGRALCQVVLNTQGPGLDTRGESFATRTAVFAVQSSICCYAVFICGILVCELLSMGALTLFFYCCGKNCVNNLHMLIGILIE